MSLRRTPQYRPDIDGLRAVAVLAASGIAGQGRYVLSSVRADRVTSDQSTENCMTPALLVLVVVYHLNSSWLPTGLVGVDIFFTISGFVVTSSLWGHLEDDEGVCAFCTDFFARRAKRLLPTALIVISSTALALALVAPQWDPRAERFLLVGLSGTFANANNWLVYERDDYMDFFSNDVHDYNPFLHLWSLGVEEQFYLVVPWLLYVCLHSLDRGTGPRTAIFWILSVISIALGWWVEAPLHASPAKPCIGMLETWFEKMPVFSGAPKPPTSEKKVYRGSSVLPTCEEDIELKDLVEKSKLLCNPRHVPENLRAPKKISGLYWLKGLPLPDVAACFSTGEWNQDTLTLKLTTWRDFYFKNDFAGRSLAGALYEASFAYLVKFKDDTLSEADITPTSSSRLWSPLTTAFGAISVPARADMRFQAIRMPWQDEQDEVIDRGTTIVEAVVAPALQLEFSRPGPVVGEPSITVPWSPADIKIHKHTLRGGQASQPSHESDLQQRSRWQKGSCQ
ncbi:Putative O-acetyltransferase SAV0974 [Durusdinium trenchii]|uniref:O-acetyltransferase SAV0974 n=1 Tax=Durusdinium trenchii TaxID=1381693 RepID=A0ABP0Q6D3_9DINO